jgi:uncharacterized protein YceH (UPF0502 family)
MNEPAESQTEVSLPKWQPLNSRQRRVLGVLVEKAKTTPDAYPLTLNAMTNGCNQKSNRSPQMNLTSDEVEQIVEELREMGAVLEIQGSGRVAKYRHQMYEWLGVDKVELAVMAELMLRGEQTVGELRTRASRMEPIASLDDLKPILRSLIEKKLVISLTPEGRGQIVTHGLYKDRELDAIRNRTFVQAPPAADFREEAIPTVRSADAGATGFQEELSELRSEVRELQDVVSTLREQIERIERILE